MSGARTVRAAAGFAGGGLRAFNQIALACVRAGGPERLDLVLHEPGTSEPLLRVQNAHGDPVGLPGPRDGIFRDARERELFAAAVRDTVAPMQGLHALVEKFLPRPGLAPADAAVELLPRLLPGLRARAASLDDPPPREDESEPRLVWLGERLRRHCAELGIRPEELLGDARADAELYRPELSGELADALERNEERWGEDLDRLRALALEVDAGLLGAWSRMERTVRRGLAEFRGASERCLDNHAGIRRSRWHHLYQALRPMGLPQDEGYSLLHAPIALGMRFPWEAAAWERLTERTRSGTSEGPNFLLLDP